MSNSNSSSPKRRPVDLLFGETEETASAPGPSPSPRTASPERREVKGKGEDMPTPSYMVEPPRPSTILRPPPPELPSDWRLSAPSEPAVFEVATEVKGGIEAAKPRRTVQLPPTPITSNPLVARIRPNGASESGLRASGTAPIGSSAPVSEEYERLASLIDALYHQVSDEVSDSPKLSAYCLSLLRDARSALKRDEFAQAEYKAEQVKDRLLRARASEEAARSAGLKLIWAWEIVVGLGAVVAILLPFFLALIPGLVPLLRAVALGALGGIMVALWNLTRYLHNREYDPAYNADYWASPLKGALIGGVVFFLSALGLVAAPGALGLSRLFGALHGANLFMYFVALLAGIAQEYILDFVRGGLAAALRSPAGAPPTLDKGGQASR